MKSRKRNMNPTKEAVAAVRMYSKRYAVSRLSPMNFYDTLSENEKRLMRDMVREIEKAAASANDVE